MERTFGYKLTFSLIHNVHYTVIVFKCQGESRIYVSLLSFSLLLLEIYPTGEVYMFHSGSLITDKNEYWQGTLCYAILE